MRKGIVAVVAAVALFTGVAFAEGPGERGGPHGEHGGPGHNPLAYVIGQLDLTDAQQEMVDAWREDGRAEREAIRAEREQAKETLKAELISGNPNARTLHDLVDERFEAQQARMHEQVDRFLALYATFTPEQKAEVAAIVEEGPPEGERPARGRWER